MGEPGSAILRCVVFETEFLITLFLLIHDNLGGLEHKCCLSGKALRWELHCLGRSGLGCRHLRSQGEIGFNWSRRGKTVFENSVNVFDSIFPQASCFKLLRTHFGRGRISGSLLSLSLVCVKASAFDFTSFLSFHSNHSFQVLKYLFKPRFLT